MEIEVEDEVGDVKTPEKQAKTDEKTTETAKTEEKSGKALGNKYLATPAVRNMLKMHNLDSSKIVGTGKDGRIMKEDVNNFLTKPKESPKSSAPKAKEPEKK